MSDALPIQGHLVLGSRFENIEVAERALLDLVSHAGCPDDDEYWMVTALREALANAVHHGNRQRPERKVRVDFTVDHDTVVIRVEDEGDGFDPTQIPDPTSDDNLLLPSGRGIFYMRQFMNRVEFSRSPKGGTVVLMVKELQSRSGSNEE